MAKRGTPTASLIAAVVIGGFCLVTGSLKALLDGGRGEYGIKSSPLDKWAYLWVGIATTVMGLAVYLLVRRMRRNRP